jgi:hypothetical protein
MEFHNRTRFPAMLFRGSIRENRMFGSLACRITFDLVGGELWPAAEQRWPITPGPWDSPQGPFAGDDLFYRGGIDLFLFGDAVAPQNKPVPRMDVKFRVGPTFQHTLSITGDRTWQKQKGKWVASAPKPFARMPLVKERAFGGTDVWDELPIPYPANPEGKGFRMFEENVEGTPLPNIEHPARLLTEWNQVPEYTGCWSLPPASPMKVAHFIEFDMANGQMKRIDPRFYNACFSDMIVPELPMPGTKVVVEGVQANGPLAFELPANPLLGKVWMNEHCHTQEPWIDQIGIEVERSQVFVTYRFPFRYVIEPFVKRVTELLPSQAAFKAVEGEGN